VLSRMREVGKHHRSSVTNGRRLLAPRGSGLDTSSNAYRRWRDLYRGLGVQLGHEPSMAEDILLRSAATLAVNSELMAIEVAAGRAIDDEKLNRTTFSLRRTLALLGLVDGPAEPAERLTLEQLMDGR
jgi:hypothetical protein